MPWCIWRAPGLSAVGLGAREGLGHRSHRCCPCLWAEVVDGELLSSGGFPMVWVVLQDRCFSLSGCVG